jgi:hypothetical protein
LIRRFALTIGPWIASDFIVIVLSETVLSETVLSETVLVLVLDGCLTCGDADRRSRRFARNCRPMGRIATLDPFEYEYEYEYRPLRRTEHEYEKNHDWEGGS